MIRSKHNLYVSTPNWFTTQNNNTVQPTTLITNQYFSGGSTTSDSQSNQNNETNDLLIKIYNKSLSEINVITSSSLTIKGQAVSVLEENKGELVVDSLWQSTKYIEVISNTELSINTSYDSSLKYGIAFYDLSRKTIQVKSLTEGVNKLVVPNNARYFRACALKSFTAFNVTYTKPIPYSSSDLSEIYNGNIESYTDLKLPYEQLNYYTKQINELSFVADSPLKLEIDSNNNLHFNISEMFSSTGNYYVTTLNEPQLILGVKTFEKGIGIGDYLIVPDIDNESLKVIHKDENKLGNLYTTGWLSAKGKQEGDSGKQANALYQLIDVLSEDNKVTGSAEGNVLTYDGTHWYAKEPAKQNVMEEIKVDGTTISKAGGVLSATNKSNVVVDNLLSSTSTNPVLNKVITNKINSLILVAATANEAINGSADVLYVLH